MNRQPSSHTAGMSLIELLLVVSLLGLLLALATPSYRQFVIRSQRSEAIAGLMRLANCQERIRASAGQFDTSKCLPSDSANYRYGYVAGDPLPGMVFTAQAEPVGKQASDACGSLLLRHSGEQSVSEAEADAGRCWAGR